MVSQWNTDIFRRVFLPTTSNEYRQSKASRFFSALTPLLISRKDEYNRTSIVILEEKRAYLAKIEGVVSRVNMWFSLEAN